VIFEIVIVAALIVLNGALAMSELAVVSSRPTRLKPLADAGNRGAAVAMRLSEDPGRFLSTVQIGITLVGVLSGAFSGATLGGRLAGWLAAQGVPASWSQSLGVGGVVVVITYLSLIVGELVPKQIALRNPEAVASRVAPAMRLLAQVGAPVVWLLDISGKAVLALLGQTAEGSSRVTEEEVRLVLAEAHVEGVIETEEQEMLSGVMRLADRSARALMTPRREVELLEADASPAETLAAIIRIGRPRIPVRQADGDVLGVLYVTDAFAALAAGEPLDLTKLLREVPVVSDMADALDVIEILRGSPNHMALVYDEYGSFEGIITTGDILEAITGTFREHIAEEPAIVTRDDGSFLVSGWMPADEFRDRLNLPRDEDDSDYETVAGLVLNHLRRLPSLGDSFLLHGWRFEVIDLDDRRIDKILVSRA
jgi:putative hemolysin